MRPSRAASDSIGATPAIHSVFRVPTRNPGPGLHEPPPPLEPVRPPVRRLDAVRVHVRQGQLSVADAGRGCRMLGPCRLLVSCVSVPAQAQECPQGAIRAGGQRSGSIPVNAKEVKGLRVRPWRTPFCRHMLTPKATQRATKAPPASPFRQLSYRQDRTLTPLPPSTRGYRPIADVSPDVMSTLGRSRIAPCRINDLDDHLRCASLRDAGWKPALGGPDGDSPDGSDTAPTGASGMRNTGWSEASRQCSYCGPCRTGTRAIRALPPCGSAGPSRRGCRPEVWRSRTGDATTLKTGTPSAGPLQSGLSGGVHGRDAPPVDRRDPQTDSSGAGAADAPGLRASALGNLQPAPNGNGSIRHWMSDATRARIGARAPEPASRPRRRGSSPPRQDSRAARVWLPGRVRPITAPARP